MWREALFFKNCVAFEFDLGHIVCFIPAAAISGFWALTRNWLANNVIGISLSIEGISLIHLPSFGIGAGLLV
jgi:Signal peptide peptidase.